MTVFAIICGSWIIGLCIQNGLDRIAKAIEAAHGITGESI
jgi:hypothetical protein